MLKDKGFLLIELAVALVLLMGMFMMLSVWYSYGATARRNTTATLTALIAVQSVVERARAGVLNGINDTVTDEGIKIVWRLEPTELKHFQVMSITAVSDDKTYEFVTGVAR